MLEFYHVISIIKHNNIEIGYRDGGDTLVEELNQTTKTIELTWNNLEEKYYKYGIFCNFNYWTFKKGRLISFFNFSFFNKNTWDIKEWKNPLNITLTIEYHKYNPSIDEVLKWHEQEKAIKYLKERGL